MNAGRRSRIRRAHSATHLLHAALRRHFVLDAGAVKDDYVLEYDWDGDRKPKTPYHDSVIYEAHVGTMTPEGTFRALIGQLPALKDLAVETREPASHTSMYA